MKIDNEHFTVYLLTTAVTELAIKNHEAQTKNPNSQNNNNNNSVSRLKNPMAASATLSLIPKNLKTAENKRTISY